MTGQRSADIVWIIALLLLGIYEAVALVRRVPDSTLSEAVWHAIAKRPYIGFMAGFLMGHFFWQRTP